MVAGWINLKLGLEVTIEVGCSDEELEGAVEYPFMDRCGARNGWD